jgi:hypothetical protein
MVPKETGDGVGVNCPGFPPCMTPSPDAVSETINCWFGSFNEIVVDTLPAAAG